MPTVLRARRLLSLLCVVTVGEPRFVILHECSSYGFASLFYLTGLQTFTTIEAYCAIRKRRDVYPQSQLMSTSRVYGVVVHFVVCHRRPSSYYNCCLHGENERQVLVFVVRTETCMRGICVRTRL